jgi:hypothetical protein
VSRLWGWSWVRRRGGRLADRSSTVFDTQRRPKGGLDAIVIAVEGRLLLVWLSSV